MMKILVDADSCPRDARELILRAAGRLGLPLVFAANRPIPGIGGENVAMEVCPAGENSADNRIAELAAPGDLAICRDLALAKRLLDKGVAVIDDRGRVFSRDSISELLSLRDFTVGLAENGMDYERTASYGRKERQAFANTLDRELVKISRRINE